MRQRDFLLSSGTRDIYKRSHKIIRQDTLYWDKRGKIVRDGVETGGGGVIGLGLYGSAISYTTVTLPKPTVARQSVSKNLENRATSADCRSTSAPIFADFLVGRRVFCRSTQVKSFVDRSADFQGFCHRRSVGRWSPDDRPTVGRLFEEIFIMLSAEGRPIIGRQSADDRQTVGRWHFTK